MESAELKERLDRIEAAFFRQKKALTFKEATVYTGLSESDLYKKTSDRTIPHYKPRGKMLYFDRDELDAWLLQNRVATIDEIESKAHSYHTRRETRINAKK